MRLSIKLKYYFAPVLKYPKTVIPAQAGIQKCTGCRIKSGMTGLGYSVAELIYRQQRPANNPT
jgi:hypothetical protein